MSSGNTANRFEFFASRGEGQEGFLFFLRYTTPCTKWQSRRHQAVHLASFFSFKDSFSFEGEGPAEVPFCTPVRGPGVDHPYSILFPPCN